MTNTPGTAEHTMKMNTAIDILSKIFNTGENGRTGIILVTFPLEPDSKAECSTIANGGSPAQVVEILRATADALENNIIIVPAQKTGNA